MIEHHIVRSATKSSSLSSQVRLDVPWCFQATIGVRLSNRSLLEGDRKTTNRETITPQQFSMVRCVKSEYLVRKRHLIIALIPEAEDMQATPMRTFAVLIRWLIKELQHDVHSYKQISIP
jgi:hypothetical protein